MPLVKYRNADAYILQEGNRYGYPINTLKYYYLFNLMLLAEYRNADAYLLHAGNPCVAQD